MVDLVANFTLNTNSLNAEFELNEPEHFDTIFRINATPAKVSELENDLNYQTEAQVTASIQAESDIINTRIDGVIEAFDADIEDINTRMIDSVVGSELIQATRDGNTITLNSQTFVFEQGVASDTWVINHNLNKRPSIDLVDSSGRAFEAVRDYVNNNQVIIRLEAATAGYAYLN